VTAAGEIVGAFGSTIVTFAEAEPPEPVTVTVTGFVAGSEAGAVYSPVAVIEPADAAHPVAFAEVNCCVAPRLIDAVVGEIVCGGGGPLCTKLTVKFGPYSVPGFETANVAGPTVAYHAFTLSVLELIHVELSRLFPFINT